MIFSSSGGNNYPCRQKHKMDPFRTFVSLLFFLVSFTIPGTKSDVSHPLKFPLGRRAGPEDNLPDSLHHVLRSDVSDTSTSMTHDFAHDHTRLRHDGVVQYDVMSDLFPSVWKDELGLSSSNLRQPESCGDGYCTCNNGQADCSNKNLAFVPAFNVSIRFLNFSGNSLKVIDRDDFFHNVSYIHGIDLGQNKLTRFSPGVFQNMTNLAFLYLGFNNLSYEALEPVQRITQLNFLGIPNDGLGPIPSAFFRRFHMPDLEALFLDDNNMWSMNFTTFVPLPSLKILLLADNQLAHQLHTDLLRNLEKLSLLSNALEEFPQTCRGNMSLFPSLKQLNLKDNEIKTVPPQLCLPKLELLELSTNKILIFTTNMFSNTKFPNLLHLYLHSIHTNTKRIERFAFNNSKINTLNLMYNHIQFGTPKVHPDSFLGCSNITHLQLSHNIFDLMTAEKFRRLFGSLVNVQYLYLGYNVIHNITRDTFSHFKSLQALFLYGNELTKIPDGAFDGLENLRQLVLRSNQISVITETTFSESLRRSLHHLDVSGNPFTCDCELIWFRQWFVSDRKRFSHSWTNYTCKNLFNTTLQAFKMSTQTCLMSRSTYEFMTYSIALIFLVSATFSTLFRFRWHIRLLLYEAFQGTSPDLRRRRLRNGQFQYDVFVSYASEDLDWVRTHLMRELEDRLGLRLCIHDRDFILGNNIVDNIVDNVVVSKKVVMVFSPNFARNQWCQFELNYCLRHVMENDDALLVLCVGDILSRDLTTAMMAVMKTAPFLMWNEEPEAIASFWGRLQIALQEILPCNP